MKITKNLLDKLTSLRRAYLDDNGKEVPNPRPLSLPIGMKRPATLQEQIRRVLRTELSVEAMEQGKESWAEANDFEINDEFNVELLETQYTLMDEEYIKPAEPEPEPEPAKDEKEEKTTETPEIIPETPPKEEKVSTT